ncbi:PEP-CTERM motif protein [Duganella sp. HH105]|nr:PEP-CTERM motif protein [Duganella sp. HH105]
MDHFSYQHSSLQFDTKVASSDPEGIVSRGQVISAGRSVYSYLDAPFGSSESTMVWTNQTRFDLQSPVPEADTYAMLLAGLGCLGFWARRRQQRSTAQ